MLIKNIIILIEKLKGGIHLNTLGEIKQEELLIQEQEDSSPKTRTRNEFCISSICEDGYHILFWDFDMIEKHYVLRSLSQIQNFHESSDIFIIESRHGFNAFCLDKLFLNEAYNILFYSRWNDFNHVRIGFKSDSWALILSPDKKLIMRLTPTDKCSFRKQSNAHYEFFKKYFDFKGLRITNQDDLIDIQLESYKQNKI